LLWISRRTVPPRFSMRRRRSALRYAVRIYESTRRVGTATRLS
jgi:hypothetical protein